MPAHVCRSLLMKRFGRWAPLTGVGAAMLTRARHFSLCVSRAAPFVERGGDIARCNTPADANTNQCAYKISTQGASVDESNCTRPGFGISAQRAGGRLRGLRERQ